MKKSIIGLVFLSAVAVNATFTLSVSMGALYPSVVGTDASTQNGAGGINGAIGVLVIDSTSSGNFPQGAALQNKTLNQYSNWGNGFYVMNIMTAFSVAVTGESTGNSASFNGSLAAVDYTLFAGSGLSNSSSNIPFAMYWFPAILDTNPATSGATGITPSTNTLVQGMNYGFFTSNVALHTGLTPTNHAFVTPANGVTNFVVQARNEDAIIDSAQATAGTFLANNAFLATNVIVPEPSTYAMILGVIALGVAIRRRK